ncbi:pirin family protein [Aminipila sp.]|uniref:pirin family protein n=1 Tax=Aminipila sp. TaxID=2060095 RepID=UPI00289819A3|nr:pirin family protein [Aminipila sp.]
MKKCRIIKEIRGQRAVDGAGVRLVRVLGSNDVKAFDPFLMLDSFDSLEASDYVAGFPMHPHRGIETITYLISGEIEHQDSLGNEGTIRSGEAQWMTAGSGILHQEMPQKSERMLGFQLWLNLPSEKKMTAPSYLSIIKDEIALKCVDGAEIRVLSGSFEEVSGITSRYLPATIYDILVFKGSEINIPVKSEETAFIFLIEGDAWVEEKRVLSKTAVLFDKGESITVMAPPDSDSRFIFFSGKPLQEPISWGGPIVMNTQEELNCAFDELREGTFIKHK